jgi:hypothetical protein
MPTKIRPRSKRDFRAFAVGAAALLCGPAAVSAAPFQFPSPSELPGFQRLRQDKNSELRARPLGKGGDTLYLLLEFKGSRPWSATYSQRGEFQEDWILEQLTHFVPESSPHPLPDPGPGSREVGEVPGLKQQWSLRGRKGAAGWMGSGVRGDRYFLVFRAQAPMPVEEGKGPLRLRGEEMLKLDTLDGWLSAPCPAPATNAAARCFRPSDASPFLVRAETSAKSTRIEIRIEEGEPLSEVRAAAGALPESHRGEYARDLSALLHGEALRLLAKAGRQAPVFSWPDWKFLEWKRGRVPPEDYLRAWKKGGQLPDPLPALEYQGDGLHLRVEIHFNGQSRILAMEAR